MKKGFSPSEQLLLKNGRSPILKVQELDKFSPQLTLGTEPANKVRLSLYDSLLCNLLCRYMSIHDNKFLRYFSGHTAKVVSLSLSPEDDTVISGSLDKSVSGFLNI